MIRDFVIKFFGNISYSDNTKEGFDLVLIWKNGQAEITSSSNLTDSVAAWQKSYHSNKTDNNAVLDLLESSPRFVPSVPTATKTISDFVLELSGTVSYLDNTTGVFNIQRSKGVLSQVFTDNNAHFNAILNDSDASLALDSLMASLVGEENVGYILPLDLPQAGLLLHYDLTDPNNVTVDDNNNISQVVNLAGSGDLIQPTESLRPPYVISPLSGRYCSEHNESEYLYQKDNIPNGGSGVVFVVYETTDSSGNVFDFARDHGASNGYFSMKYNAGGFSTRMIATSFVAGNTGNLTGPSTHETNRTFINTVASDGSSNYMYIDRLQVSFDQGPLDDGAWMDTVNSFNDADTVGLGALIRQPTPVGHVSGRIYEAIVYDDNFIGSSEIIRINRLLARKYAVKSS